MGTSKEYRERAKAVLELANKATDLYAKVALLELANEFTEMAEKLERDCGGD